MRKNKITTPEGTGDLMLEQCRAREDIADRLSQIYVARGYGEVKTPTLEFFNIFTHESAYFPQEEMYKLVDHKGRLMVVRPDCTIPIARMVATRMKNIPRPLRLYYNQNVLRVSPNMRGRSNETAQVGVEVLGASSYKADLEIIETAAHSLKAICATCKEIEGEFRIEICHIGFFKALIQVLQAEQSEKEQIHRFIEEKNFAMLSDILKPYQNQQAARALQYLPRLFGGREVLDKARALFDYAGEVLDYLESLYDGLEELGLAGKVIVDLGLVNQSDYYTGVIFRGYVHGSGFEVLSGGRYDHLLEDFGEPLEATGFAVYVDRLAKQILDLQPQKYVQKTDVLIHCDNICMTRALRYQEQMEDSGKICEMSLFDTREEAMNYCKEKGITQLHLIIDENLEVLPVNESISEK